LALPFEIGFERHLNPAARRIRHVVQALPDEDQALDIRIREGSEDYRIDGAENAALAPMPSARTEMQVSA
jgi:hypothetical protein